MPKFLNLPVMAALACLISCNSGTNNSPKTIKIAEADMINIPLEKIISISDFIPLELTAGSALPEAALFIECISGYYLMDKNKMKMVYQFDTNGRFIRTIGQTGQGPGEYPRFLDALVTESGIEILSGMPHTDVYQYDLDGKFVRSVQMLEQYSSSFTRNPETGDYYFLSPIYLHLIQQVNGTTLQPVDSFIVRNPELTVGDGGHFHSTTKDGFLFCQLSDNRIFRIGKDTAFVRYQFDVGSLTPNYDELKTESVMKMITEGEFWYIYSALENSDWLYLLTVRQYNSSGNPPQFYSLLYHKKTEKLYLMPDTPELGPLFYPAFGLSDDNVLYTAVQPVSIYDSDVWKTGLAKKNIPLTSGGNLIVTKIHLNDILR